MSPSPGQKQFLDALFPAVYDHLRHVAQAMLGRQLNATLNPTAVVHEAYGRLAASGKIPNVTEASFKRIAAHVMRQVLCDAARRRSAAKRGGQNTLRVPADDQLHDADVSAEQLLLVHDFLDRLSAISVRQTAVVELLFFGGLTMAEAAEELQISVSTAEREWRSARAFLSREAGAAARHTSA